jgi:hypothetical protein
MIYPAFDSDCFHWIEFLVIRGKDRVEDVDLTEYAWMIHELTHSLLYKNSEAVKKVITKHLQYPLRDIKTSSIPNRGHTGAVRRQQIQQILGYWEPSDNHYDWSHELVIDVVGLIATGPAYVKNFLVETESHEIQPFRLEQSHPPFAVRCQALCSAAESLNLSGVVPVLKKRYDLWTKRGNFGAPDNMYRAASDQAFMDSAIQAAIELAHDLHLPSYTEAQMEQAAARILTGKIPDLGVEILLAAWYAHDNLGSKEFQRWTQDVVENFGTATTPGSR